MGVLKELKIMKDHWYFKIIKKIRPLTIHTECLHKENVWARVKDFVNSGNNAIWYVLTPENFDFVKTESGCNMPKEKWEKLILDRYNWLKDMGQRINLHTHLRIKMSMYESEKEKREDIKRKIKNGVNWLRKNGFNPKEVVFGWWSSDRFADDVARKHGLRVVERLDYYFIHDYDLIKS